MRYLVLVAMLGGCGGGAATLPPVTWGEQWKSFGDFEVQIHPQAAGLTWQQAEESCNAIGSSVHMPTELQWTAMHAAGFSGIDTPASEWFWSKGATPTWYKAAIDTYFFDPPAAVDAIEFRCVR